MSASNQGNANVVVRSAAYDNPSYVTRQSLGLSTITGSGGTSNKFYAFTQTTIYGVTFIPTVLGSSTYTVNGTATTSAMSAYCVFVANTNTTGTAINLATTTVSAAAGPFIIVGTGIINTNVNVPGIPGVGGWQKYAINTLGGTNTTMPWGTTTYSLNPAGGNQAGQGGVYMNPGDSFQVIAGTDATGTASCILEYSLGAPTGLLIA